MLKNVTIVMYHYVRELRKTRYPKIRGLNVDDFIKQLKTLEENYTPVRMEDCIRVLNGDEAHFPDNAVLLTFDDGYLEHFTHVFPILEKRGLQGSFFAPVQSTVEDRVLDVNKIHFILAVSGEPEELLCELESEIKKLKGEFDLEEPAYYFEKVGSTEHPYDPPEIIKFKRVLQRELPYEARQEIVSALFNKYVDVPEDVFSAELYMNEDQLKTMIRSGMYVGGHGYSHKWLDSIDEAEQKFELDQTEHFLDSLGTDPDYKVMCYPYGGYDNSLLSQLERSGFTAGLTTVSETAVLCESNRFELARIDTNEMGKK
jgi:peptidoglycan/xylan/chitin deacetylase (PgdA/CDA1 family)